VRGVFVGYTVAIAHRFGEGNRVSETSAFPNRVWEREAGCKAFL
jgi:hypothetical protein